MRWLANGEQPKNLASREANKGSGITGFVLFLIASRPYRGRWRPSTMRKAATAPGSATSMWQAPKNIASPFSWMRPLGPLANGSCLFCFKLAMIRAYWFRPKKSGRAAATGSRCSIAISSNHKKPCSPPWAIVRVSSSPSNVPCKAPNPKTSNSMHKKPTTFCANVPPCSNKAALGCSSRLGGTNPAHDWASASKCPAHLRPMSPLASSASTTSSSTAGKSPSGT